jgi:hypothetical protein
VNEMDYLGIEIEWGNTIFDDNTIEKTIITRYEDLKSLEKAWALLQQSPTQGITRKARLLSLTIKTSQFVPSEEYFKFLKES